MSSRNDSTMSSMNLSAFSSPASALEIAAVNDLRAALAPIRTELLSHSIYNAVDSLPRLRLFMSHHVFAVWDFMCLAKRLQRDMTSLQELWLPPSRPSLARFINSVILSEESDIDPDGHVASHLGLYLAAMEEARASVEPILRFIDLVREGVDAQSSLAAVGAPWSVRRFVSNTMQVVRDGTTIEVLASFLFGREDLIPEMFLRLLPQWGDSRQARWFAYYVNRHIEIDGAEHGPVGLNALAEMAGGDVESWRIAKQSAQSAIAARIALWDGIYASLGAA
jgi:Protein of unknown function (DUF3050)